MSPSLKIGLGALVGVEVTVGGGVDVFVGSVVDVGWGVFVGSKVTVELQAVNIITDNKMMRNK